MSIPEPEKIGEEIGNQLRDLKRIYPLFQKWKQKMNVIDYGDMILSTYELLQLNNGILEKIQDQYQNIIIISSLSLSHIKQFHHSLCFSFVVASK